MVMHPILTMYHKFSFLPLVRVSIMMMHLAIIEEREVAIGLLDQVISQKVQHIIYTLTDMRFIGINMTRLLGIQSVASR